MDFVYFVALAAALVVVALSWLVVGYFRSKPILHKTLVDLINTDLATSFGALGLFSIVMSTLMFLRKNFGLQVDDSILLATTILNQFSIQNFLVYTMYNIVVRYSYVYNQRIIFEDYSDEFMRKSFFLLSFAISASLCLITFAIGMRADQYLILSNVLDAPLYCKTEFAFITLTIISVVVNVAFTGALKRHSANLPQEQEEEAKSKLSTFKKIFVVLVLIVLIAMFRIVMDYLRASPFIMPTLIMMLLDGVMALYIMTKDPLRRHVMAKLGKGIGIKASCNANFVSPVV